jgi:hypothetical protein
MDVIPGDATNGITRGAMDVVTGDATPRRHALPYG